MSAPRRALATGAIVLLAALATVAGWWRWGAGEVRLLERHPTGIMGTSCTLAAPAPGGAGEAGETALAAAEAELRQVEALMSNWIDASEVSRFNAAPAGERFPLSTDTLAVLRSSRRFWELSGGAFDVTCRPQLELWKESGRRGLLPSPEELAAARARSHWDQLTLDETSTGSSAVKSAGTLQVDLGGIAKGYGVDRALDAIRRHGLPGGLVEVGGDLAVFGRSPAPGSGGAWLVGLRDPRADRAWGTLALREAAVCTSGNYARFVTIDGRRYSHIVDPRSGRPAQEAASVTVVAPDALTADAWATALAVLGRAGLERLPADGSVQALVIVEEEGELVAAATAGFAGLLSEADVDLRSLLAGGRRAAR